VGDPFVLHVHSIMKKYFTRRFCISYSLCSFLVVTDQFIFELVDDKKKNEDSI
jgi:hypothetical protein